MNFEKDNQLFKASLVIALALVGSSFLGARAIQKFATKDQSITVTGSARKRIKSDFIVWHVVVKSQAAAVTDSYRNLNENVKKVREYLLSKNIPAAQIVVAAIQTQTLAEKTPDGSETGRVSGYELSQTLEISSTEVDKITQISRAVTELLNQGILLESQPPAYLYTKLSDLKIAMLEEASKDAKARAQQIASSTGSSIGTLSAAKMGVFQITAADSTDVSGYGVNDTTSIEKDITSVVTISFNVG